MEIHPSLVYTMGHETNGNRQAAGEAPPAGSPSAEGGQESAGDRPRRRGLGQFRVPMVSSLPQTWSERAESNTYSRPTAQTISWRTQSSAGTAPGGTHRVGVQNRFVDAEADRPRHLQRIRRSLPPLPRLEALDSAGLELPEARTPGPSARREGHRALETPSVALYKKRRKDLGPIWSSSMRVGSSSSPTWRGPGVPGVARLSSTICSGTIGSRPSRHCRSPLLWKIHALSNNHQNSPRRPRAFQV